MMFVDRIKPMFLEILANPEMNPEDLKNNKLKSYEMELATEAKTRKLKIDGLETIDYQISIFDSIPYKNKLNNCINQFKVPLLEIMPLSSRNLRIITKHKI